MKRPLVFLCLLIAGRAFAEDALQPPPRIHIGGFADLIVRTTSPNIAALDLFATVRLGDAWSGLAEAIAQKTWRDDDPQGEIAELDLERLYLSYRTSDAFRVEIGQTHTGIVRWNEREHRSRFLQTPIDVPAIARRPQDDGAWPLRFVGVWAAGRAGGPLALTWEAGVGAGPGAERDVIPILSRDRSPAGFVSFAIAPESISGLDFGAAFYAQHVPSKPDALRERDLTLFTNYVNGGTEVRAEWARMNHSLTRMRTTFHNQGYYVLISRRLPGSAGHARPYVLLDRQTIDPLDPYLASSASEKAWVGGVRYDFTPRLTGKVEHRSQRAAPGGSQSILSFQLSVSF